MKKYFTMLTAVAALIAFSCSGSGDSESRSEAGQETTPADSTYAADEYEQMQGDTASDDRNTGSFGSPGSGYGTENESGTAASGTSTPADNAAGDSDDDGE